MLLRQEAILLPPNTIFSLYELPIDRRPNFLNLAPECGSIEGKVMVAGDDQFEWSINALEEADGCSEFL